MRLVQYWHSEVVPDDVRAGIESFRVKNPQFEHVLFSEQTAESFIRQHYSNREIAAFQACAVPAMKSDYFRYCALLKFGGIYADVDMLCLQPLSPLVKEISCALFFYRPSLVVTNDFFFVRSADLPLLTFVLQIATLNIERECLQSVWLATGPGIISQICAICRHGSVDAFLASLNDEPSDYIELATLAETISHFAGSKISKLLDGTQFKPIEQRNAYVSDAQCAYKKNAHWTDWTGSIYR